MSIFGGPFNRTVGQTCLDLRITCDVKKIVIPDKLIKATGTVILVDDEKVVQEVCKELLEHIGSKVFLANDGKKAVELYRKNQDEIDIVLLDMIMPNMSGGGAYDRMKEINPDIKVLLSSGYSIDGEATAILSRGCDGFIQKPFSINELSGKIRKILEIDELPRSKLRDF